MHGKREIWANFRYQRWRHRRDRESSASLAAITKLALTRWVPSLGPICSPPDHSQLFETLQVCLNMIGAYAKLKLAKPVHKQKSYRILKKYVSPNDLTCDQIGHASSYTFWERAPKCVPTYQKLCGNQPWPLKNIRKPKNEIIFPRIRNRGFKNDPRKVRRGRLFQHT